MKESTDLNMQVGCDDRANELLGQMARGLLETEERLEVLAHIHKCAICSEEYDTIRQILPDLMSIAGEHVPLDRLTILSEHGGSTPPSAIKADIDDDTWTDEKVFTHLALCPHCEQEYGMLQSLNREIAEEERKAATELAPHKTLSVNQAEPTNDHNTQLKLYLMVASVILIIVAGAILKMTHSPSFAEMTLVDRVSSEALIERIVTRDAKFEKEQEGAVTRETVIESLVSRFHATNEGSGKLRDDARSGESLSVALYRSDRSRARSKTVVPIPDDRFANSGNVDLWILGVPSGSVFRVDVSSLSSISVAYPIDQDTSVCMLVTVDIEKSTSIGVVVCDQLLQESSEP